MIAMNIGGTIALKNGISVTMVHAVSFLVNYHDNSFILLELVLHKVLYMVVKQLALFFIHLMVNSFFSPGSISLLSRL